MEKCKFYKPTVQLSHQKVWHEKLINETFQFQTFDENLTYFEQGNDRW